MRRYEKMAACVLHRIDEHNDRKKRRKKIAAMVVVPLCIVCLGILIGFGIRNGAEPEGVTLTGPEITVSDNTLMPPFFIYNGGFYRPCSTDAEESLVGERLGYATGNIDEGTPKGGYVNFSGSYRGDFYEVTGFDPSFLLCVKEQEGSVTLYINNHGYALKTGNDLFEKRLHLKGHITGASWQLTDETEERQIDGSELKTVNDFLKNLCKAPFAYREVITQTPYLSDKAVGNLSLKTDYGFTVRLTLYDGGYVMLQGLREVCVAMEPKDFDAITALFE